MSAPVAVLGGAFNPVHFGHIRSARELREQLGLAEVRLMPTGLPPHRPAPEISSEQRAQLVRMAVESEPGLVCDERELRRPGPSYTIDSMTELRRELGPSRGLALVIGADVVAGLERWRRWRELFDLAHLVIIGRPGYPALPERGAVAQWLARHLVTDAGALQDSARGVALRVELSPLDISATEIRAALAAGRSVRNLVPGPVLRHIQHHHWYAAGVATHGGGP